MEAFEVTVCCCHGSLPQVLTLSCQPGEKVSELKVHIEKLSDAGKRPSEDQILIHWGQELENETVLSALEPPPTNIVLMMRDTEAQLDQKIDLPPSERRGADAEALFQMIRQLPVPAAQPQVPLPEADPGAVANLTDMGFPAERAKKALLLNGNVLEAAMEWLFTHADDPEVDVPLTPMQLQQLAGVRAGPAALLSMMGMGGGGSPQRPGRPAAASPQQQPQQQQSEEMNALLGRFEPLLQQIAAVANGDSSGRAAIEQQLPQLVQHGWQLSDAVHMLWQGQRDLEMLQQGADTNSATLIARMLEHTNSQAGSSQP